MPKVQICEGVAWETSETASCITAYSEAALAGLQSVELVEAIQSADADRLVSLRREKIGTGISGSVYTVAGQEDTVLKLHREPFSGTAINASLAEGIPQVPSFLNLGTPDYLAFVGRKHVQRLEDWFPPAITVMSRVRGLPLTTLPAAERDKFVMSKEWSEIYRVCREALDRVNVDRRLAYLDVRLDNLMSERDVSTFRDAFLGKVLLIDQSSREWADGGYTGE